MISENKNTFLIRLMKPVLLIYHNVGTVFHPFSLPHLVFHSFSFLSSLFSFFSSIFLSSSLFLSLLFPSGTKNKKRLYSTTEEKKGAKECGKKGVEEGKEKLKEGKEENKNGSQKEERVGGRKDGIKKRRKGGRESQVNQLLMKVRDKSLKLGKCFNNVMTKVENPQPVNPSRLYLISVFRFLTSLLPSW